MSDNRKENDKKNNENDPYDFFKLTTDEKDEKNGSPKKNSHFPFWGILLIGILILGIINIFSSQKVDSELEFSEFRKLVESGKIVEVEITDYYFIGYDEPAGSS